MSPAPQPTRDEFAAYWKGHDTPSWRRLVPHAIYLGGLALYAFAVRRLDAEGRFWFLSIAAASAYLILLPYLFIRWVHTRKARFIRCLRCGDWFGQDSSGRYHGPNPKFRTVLQTGKCGKCGTQILLDL